MRLAHRIRGITHELRSLKSRILLAQCSFLLNGITIRDQLAQHDKGAESYEDSFPRQRHIHYLTLNLSIIL